MAKTQGPTYQPSKIKRIRKFGFRRNKVRKNRSNVVNDRRRKKRKKLSASVEFGSKMRKNKLFSRRR